MSVDIDGILDNLRAKIDKHGYAIVGIAGLEESLEDSTSPYAYTVGLAMDHGYEYIVIGAPPSIANDIITAVKSQVTEPRDDLFIDGILKNGRGFKLHKLDITVPTYAANRFCPLPFDTYQIFWPDAEGKHPDDLDCEPAIAQMQNPLGCK